jgi:hypothetical protein
MQVRGLVQRQVEGVRPVFEGGKKAGKQVFRIANLWGNSIVVDGCMVGSRSVFCFATRLCASREYYTRFPIESAVERSIYVCGYAVTAYGLRHRQ